MKDTKKAKQKKQNTENKNMVLQWLIPAVILFGYLLIVMFTYYGQIRTQAKLSAQSKIIQHTEGLSVAFSRDVMMVEQAAKTAAASFGREDTVFADSAVQKMEQIVNQSYAIGGFLCNAEGIARDLSGREYNIQNDVNYVMAMTNTFVTSDMYFDEETGKYIICIYAPIQKNNAVLGVVGLKYPVDRFLNMPRTSEHDGLTIYSLVGADGMIACSAGNKISMPGTKIDTLVKDDNGIGTTKAKKLIQSIQNRKNGLISCIYNGLNRVLVYQATEINNCYIIEIYSQKYINQLELREYKSTKGMIYKMLAALFVFVVMVVLLNVLNKKIYFKQNMELQSKAETDLLTGLLNKIATQKHIQDYLEGEGINDTGMLFVLDIDNFKKINDTMGHAFGDEVLSTLGIRLRNEFRVSDIVGRIGGDEFIVFLKNIKDDETKTREAERLTRFFKDFKAGEYVKYSATASIGVAMYPKDGKTFDELYKAADKGVYRAKQRGKNQLAFYGDND